MRDAWLRLQNAVRHGGREGILDAVEEVAAAVGALDKGMQMGLLRDRLSPQDVVEFVGEIKATMPMSECPDNDGDLLQLAAILHLDIVERLIERTNPSAQPRAYSLLRSSIRGERGREETPEHHAGSPEGENRVNAQHLPQPIPPPPQEYWDAKRWVEANPEDVEAYADQWIAVLDGGIVASGDPRHVHDLVRRQYPGRHPYISLIERNPGVNAHPG